MKWWALALLGGAVLAGMALVRWLREEPEGTYLEDMRRLWNTPVIRRRT